MFRCRDKDGDMDFLREICSRCGLTYGSHHGGTSPYPIDYCPGHEGRMDWKNGPGTVFKPSGKYKEPAEKTSKQKEAKMEKTCLNCSHKILCSVFKSINDVRTTINEMLDYDGMIHQPSGEILIYIASGCWYFSTKKHELTEV